MRLNQKQATRELKPSFHLMNDSQKAAGVRGPVSRVASPRGSSGCHCLSLRLFWLSLPLQTLACCHSATTCPADGPDAIANSRHVSTCWPLPLSTRRAFRDVLTWSSDEGTLSPRVTDVYAQARRAEAACPKQLLQLRQSSDPGQCLDLAFFSFSFF